MLFGLGYVVLEILVSAMLNGLTSISGTGSIFLMFSGCIGGFSLSAFFVVLRFVDGIGD